MNKSKNTRKDRRKTAIRVICIALALLMVSSTLLAVFGIFEF